MKRISEYVTTGHPDKTADFISEYLLDRYLEKDPNTGQLAPHLPANPRLWTKKDVQDLARSMKDTPELAEARGPIVVPYEDGHYLILGGNMRREAAAYNKEPDLLCAVLPADTPTAKMKEIVLKDNSSFGKFNFEMLRKDWGEFEFQDIGIQFPEAPKGTKKATEDNYDVEAALKKAGKNTKTQRGDMVRLGDHVLLCGDVTDLNALKTLMGGGARGFISHRPAVQCRHQQLGRQDHRE